MRAIVQGRYGSPDELTLQELPTPTPGVGEVLVQIKAASLNAADWHVMRGDPYLVRLVDRSMFGWRGPKHPVRGSDFAGVVAAVGRDVTGFEPGDEVFGEGRGSFAEYVLAPADVIAHKPASLTFEQAAAIPLAGTTALLALRDVGAVSAGDRVLVNGASGGVGTFAVQIASALGAEVTGVCSTRNVPLVESLGAVRVIDYTRADFTHDAATYDVVLDLVGNRSLRELRSVLTDDGVLLLSGGGTSEGGSLVGPMGLFIRGQLAATFRRRRVEAPMAKPSAEHLRDLVELIESGRLTPAIDRTFPLAHAAEAMRYLEVEHARAKVVLVA